MSEEVTAFLDALERPTDDEAKGAEPFVREFTNYSREKYLRYDGDKLYGGWAGSFGGACIKKFPNMYLHRDSIVQLRKLGQCDGGDWIVICRHH